jgi:hypothetical protein
LQNRRNRRSTWAFRFPNFEYHLSIAKGSASISSQKAQAQTVPIHWR